jgi:hypothetical protein
LFLNAAIYMKLETLNKVKNVLDEILSEYGEDHHIIFDNDSERLSEHYRLVNEKLTSWNKQKKCIYRNCTNKSVRRSHSIQKSGPLTIIAKSSKVLTPEFNQKTGKIELVEKGLSRASVFPGFCKKHEALFNSFENSKNTASMESLPLQIYRSICREIVRLKHQIKFGEKLLSEYERFRNNKLKIIMEKKLGSDWMEINNFKVNEISSISDSLIDFGRKKHIELKNTLEELENQHLSEIEECLKIDGGKSKIVFNSESIRNNKKIKLSGNGITFKIDEQIPVALSGMGNFRVIENNDSKSVIIILIVLPDTKSTTIVIYGKISDANYIHNYLSKLNNSFDILNMVEQWMIRCTDHWFLSHNVWDKKNQIERAAILKEILNDEKGLTDKLNFSIFDDVRKSMIKTWETTENTESQIEILQHEKAKLQFKI